MLQRVMCVGGGDEAAALTDTLATWTDDEDLIDISALSGVSADTAVNDQTGEDQAHVATDLGDVLVVQGETAADAIVYINTAGDATTSFADFEVAIYVTGGAASTWTTDDFVIA